MKPDYIYLLFFNDIPVGAYTSMYSLENDLPPFREEFDPHYEVLRFTPNDISSESVDITKEVSEEVYE
jgi:hypothetical protein